MILSASASPGIRRLVFIVNMLAATATLLYLWTILGEAKPSTSIAQSVSSSHSTTSTQTPSSTPTSDLGSFALAKVLDDASPIFGQYQNRETKTSTWMKAYPDSTSLFQMNIPGTHDSATWNYSLATQQSLTHITNLVQDTEANPDFYRCQDKSFIDMLNDGIRAFDLRYAYDVTNSTLVFWHGPGLQSETATVDDVLFGYYQWLDDHPSEVVFLSFQYEGSTSRLSSNDQGVQQLLFNALTSPAAKHYIKQDNTLGTLGSARGKIVLLRRFDLALLPTSYTAQLPGLHFSPNDWTDNGPNITLIYDTETESRAYIEDYYSPETAVNSTAEENIRYKLNATVDHLKYAASDAHPDDLFWNFASSTSIGNDPPDTPRIQALGNGSVTPKGGVNDQLLPVLKTLEGKRLGIVMFDFYEQPDGLLETFLGLLPPS